MRRLSGIRTCNLATIGRVQKVFKFLKGINAPESERHGVVAFLHLAEKRPRGLHFQPVLLARVSLVNGGPLS